MTVPRSLILCVENKINKPQSRCMGFLTLYGKVTCFRKQGPAQTNTSYKAVSCA